MHGSDSPLNYMNEQEAAELKQRIFAQLDEFDGFISISSIQLSLADTFL